MRTRLITLDITNTIIRVRGGVGGMYKTVAEKLNLDSISQTSAECINSNFRTSFQLNWSKHPNFGFGQMPAREWWDNVTADTLESILNQRQDVRRFCDALYQTFTSPDAYEIMPGAKTALQLLSSEVDLVALTNNDSRIRTVLDKLFSPDVFKRILISNEQGIHKPDVRIFLKACEGLDLSREQILHVGDSYAKDYLPARALGMQALLLSPGGLHPQCPKTHQISEFQQLLKLVD